MSLILPLDMYQIQLRSTQFTNEVYFVEGLANYIENITYKNSARGNEKTDLLYFI